jgi:DNA invertase Pin-like site-specific DNA recombinase
MTPLRTAGYGGQAAAIYARYSSDLQNDRSIEDQVALCRKFAATQGWPVSHTYDDRAQSGTTFNARLGLMRLLRDAREKKFKILIVEHSDRLSRHPGDIHHIRDTLTFAGCTIIQVSGGELTMMGAAVSGLVSSLMLQGLGDKVRRGHAGIVSRGRHAGGRAYGYRAVKGEPGQLEIVEEEAGIIRGIYADFLAGQSPRSIAGHLNARSIAAPRGARWNASTLNGSAARGSGILGNELYAGTITYNKVAMVKNPETRKRVSRVNAPELWQRSAAPALAIVSPELFAAVQARRGHRPHRSHARKPRTLLSGLLRCSACKGALVIKDRSKGMVRVHCSTARESGSCANGRAYTLARIERAVLQGLREHLEDPEMLAAYVKAYNEERSILSADRVKNRGQIERRLANATAELERIVLHLSKDIVKVETVAARIKDLEAEKIDLATKLANSAPPDVVTLHPGAVARYREQLESLSEGLENLGYGDCSDLSAAFRNLVASVTVAPDYSLEIAGRLEAVTGCEAFPHGLKVGVFSGFGGSERGT